MLLIHLQRQRGKESKMKKHRLMVLGVSLLASLGVLSSGFAGWVIAAGSQEASGEGSISADYDVQTTGIKSVTVKGTPDTSVNFSGSTDGQTGWLSSNTKSADLDASFAFTIETYQTGAKLLFTNLAFSEIEGQPKDSSYQAAANKKVVGSLPAFLDSKPDQPSTVGYIELSNATKTVGKLEATADVDSSATSIDVTFKIHFAWGEKFGGKNPLDYYNVLSKTDSLISEASTNLALLKSAAGAKFKLSFTVGVTA
ncbi:hypothetical protein MRZ76_00070 [bacterium]|nr:hypothetical protein [bacterium]